MPISSSQHRRRLTNKQTPNEQHKRRIPHHSSKSSIRQLHPSNAGTACHVNIPPDPGEIKCYIEFPALECQDEETNMQQEAANNHTPHACNNIQDNNAVSQGTDQGDPDTHKPNTNNAKDTMNSIKAPMVNRLMDTTQQTSAQTQCYWQ